MNAIYRTLSVLPGNWKKGARTEHGEGCGLALLSDNMENEWDQWETYRDLMVESAKEQFSERMYSSSTLSGQFIEFNDHPDTTEEDVIAVMEKAAVKYDEVR